MNLKIFTTSRQIRKYLEDKENQFLDKFYTLGEFLDKIIIVDNKKFIDETLRKKYLFKAIEDVNVEKLGISKEFINFFDDSNFIFSFFNELFLEDVEIDNVIMNDIYLDYVEHLEILKEIKNNYKTLIEADGYIDKFLIEEFRINESLLEGIEKIELILDGYLSKFDLKILTKIKTPIEIKFNVDKFNKSLIEKSLKISVDEGSYILDFHNLKLQQLKQTKPSQSCEIAYFSERLNQVNFVFAKIAQMVDKGIKPENIVVILPDEDFSEFLELFDKYNNLNFAMGRSFRDSNLYIKLRAIYDYLTDEDEVAFSKCKDVFEEYQNSNLIDFIKRLATNKELKIIDEELFKLSQFNTFFSEKKEFLHFILEKFKTLTFDDAYSGKITCMGVLESRGMQFDGVVIIDFNEDIVPRVNDSDMFLNSFIRQTAKLPTRMDKENLQKHYYFELISNAKEVAISYIQNEEKSPSRFLYELGFKLPKNSSDEKYKEIVYNLSNEKELSHYSDEFNIKYPLYPTTLKTLLECPKKYYFSKILKIENETIEEEEFFGNIFHEAIQETIKQKENINSVDEYFNVLIENITSKIKSKELLFDLLVKWEDKLKEFCKKDYEDMKYSKNELETTKEFIFEGQKLACRVDRVDIKEKEIILIDYKTSKNAKKSEEYIYDFQTTFYFLWAKENYPNKTIKTIIWDISEVKKIDGILKIDILKEVLDNLPMKVKEANDIVFDEKILKKAADICRYCDYNVACGRE